MITEIPRLRFQIGSLDLCTKGGAPLGRTTLIYGPPKSAKTTAGLYLLRSFLQTDKRKAIIYSQEDKLDAIWAEKIGVDFKRVTLRPPGFAEKVLDEILDMAEHDRKIGFVLNDSIREMPSLRRREDLKKGKPPSVGDQHYAPEAHALNEFFKDLPIYQYPRREVRSPFTVVVINHESHGVSPFPGLPAPVVIPGGGVQRFAAALRIRFLRPEYDKGQVVLGIKISPGVEINFRVEANLGGQGNPEGKFRLLQVDRESKLAGSVEEENFWWVWGRETGYISGHKDQWAVGEINGFLNQAAIFERWLSDARAYAKDRDVILGLAIERLSKIEQKPAKGDGRNHENMAEI